MALWWRDSRTLEFVRLGEAHVGAVQQVSGRASFISSLVREALRTMTGK